MHDLPSELTPLNRHSLKSLEKWLEKLGAKPSKTNSSEWICLANNWSTQIEFEQDELRVTWIQAGKTSQCCFSYRLMRKDVEEAINAGPC
tara:strand:- start:287 stop:556 length:270 start_codon:yes stop_codon:yes gene_type:complete